VCTSIISFGALFHPLSSGYSVEKGLPFPSSALYNRCQAEKRIKHRYSEDPCSRIDVVWHSVVLSLNGPVVERCRRSDAGILEAIHK
jgi:hypothetical protein